MDLGNIQLTHAVTVKANILPAFAVPETVFQTFIKVLSPSPGSAFAGARFGDCRRTGTWTQTHGTAAVWYLLCFYQAVQEPFLLLNQLTVPLLHLHGFFFCCLDLGRTKQCNVVRLGKFSRITVCL